MERKRPTLPPNAALCPVHSLLGTHGRVYRPACWCLCLALLRKLRKVFARQPARVVAISFVTASCLDLSFT